MAAFEFGNYPDRTGRAPTHPPAQSPAPEEAAAHHRPPSVLQEPILAFKIYDSCRHKICLGPREIGAARHPGGGFIEPHQDARNVTIENLNVRAINVLRKTHTMFRRGFYDIELQYVLEYDLRFVSHEGRTVEEVPACSTYSQRASLFGSIGQDITMFTDFLGGGGNFSNGDPFILVEAKALPLAAEIRREGRPGPGPREERVFPTIGLFTIIKLFRLVSLQVESRGFVIPKPCSHVIPPNPCDFFDGMDFPMDSFAPPQKREFDAGISCNIPLEAEEAVEEAT